jgi:hypothetical protein
VLWLASCVWQLATLCSLPKVRHRDTQYSTVTVTTYNRSMKGQGGGGTARGGGKSRSGGGSLTIKKTKARQCQNLEGNILVLREALFEKDGKDKDVSRTIAAAFMKFDRHGLNLRIGFETKLDNDTLNWAFELTKHTMEDVYDASGYGTCYYSLYLELH